MSWAEAQAPAEARFWARVVKTDACWNWTGTPSGGYGRIRVDGKRIQAHVYSFTLHGGVIPPGMVLDHQCRNQLCVRPSHLEPVTNRINLLRGDTIVARQAAQTECLRGHPLSGGNLYRRPNGKRECRQCRRDTYHGQKTMKAGDQSGRTWATSQAC